MTAEPDLLPLPEWAHRDEVVADMSTSEVREEMTDYARANVEHHIAAKDAEVEALRAEVERLTFEMERLQQQYDERTACMIVHRGSALACSDAVRAAYSDEHHRAERLAEALREAQPFIGWTGSYPELHAKIDALLREQEEGRG